MAGGSTQKGAAIKSPAHSPQRRIGARASVVLLACACVLTVVGAGCGAASSPARKRFSPPPVVLGPSFAAPLGFATGRGPSAVAIGDLNGDRKGDVVTANENASTVSVLLNHGNGRFAGRTDYGTLASPGSIAIGDLNRDGRPDVVTTSGRHTVSVLLNRGDGSFRPRRDYRTGPDPSAVAVADLDDDGKLDLTVANADSVSVLINRGSTFAPPTEYRVGDAPMSLAVADLNGDGEPDVATASNEGNSSVLFNRGDGTFRRGHDYDSTTGPTWAAAADLNGDGAQDIVVASNDWSDEVEDEGVTLQPAFVYVFAGRASGTLGRPHTFLGTYGYAEGIDGLAVGDLNGDGKPDLVVARDQSNYDAGFISLLLNGGDGSFRQRLDYRVGPEGDASGDVALGVGDLNGDGRPDVVSADASTNIVTVLMSTPGRCNVQDVSRKTVSVASGYEGLKLSAARRTLAAAHCRVGTIRGARPDYGEPKGRVISQEPEFGAALPGGSRVDLVVSKGRHR